MKMGFGVTQGHQNRHYLIEHIRLYIRLPYVCLWLCLYLLRFRRYSCILVKNRYPLVFGAPVGVTPSDLHNDPWWRKTRMMGLSDSERISMIRSAVLIQYTRVTDRQTDGQSELAWHIRAIAYMLSHVTLTIARLFFPSLTSSGREWNLIADVVWPVL